MSIDRGHGIATSSVLADSYDLDALIADTEAAKVAALAAQVAAETAETNAETAETNASQSATNAATSETNIAGSEAVCAASEAAASASATAAATSETNASTSETNAGTSETNAGTSAANASTSETNASTSATNASNSASSASTSASTATTQASNASTSATNAASSETNAANSATAAATSETNIGNAEANCASSATSASSSASSATTSAAQASTSATSASNSATTATTKASEASTSATNAATSATNAATSLTTFQGQYVSQATAPASPTTGDLWFDTTAGIMKVYDGSGFVNAGSSVNGIENSVEHTATSGQTSFTATYDPGYLNVFLNGVKLDSTDYTATDGSTVVLDTGATLNDSVFIQSFGTFELADHYSKTASDARFLGLAGGTMTGALTTTDLNITDTTPNLKFTDTDGNNLANIAQSGSHLYIDNDSTGAIRLRNNGNQERLHISAAGNVGIGTSSPQSDLDVTKAGGGKLTLRGSGNSGGDVNTIEFRDRHNAGSFGAEGQLGAFIKGVRNGAGVDHSLTFGTTNVDADATERMRIDSAGNVGIGTSSTFGKASINSNGAPATSGNMSTGLTVHNNSGGTAINIGTYDTGGYSYIQSAYVNSAGTTRDLAFLTGATERMRVTDNGLTFNGDTAAANALDDYEEGTFTPAYYSSGGGETVTHDIQQGRYTKVGDLVTIHILVGTDAISGGSSNCRISGLPFTASQTASTSVGLGYGFLSTGPRYVIVNNLSSSLQLYPTHGSATQLPWASLNTNSNDNRLYITMSYWAT